MGGGEYDVNNSINGVHFNTGDPYYNPNLTLEKEDFSIKI